MFTDASVFNGDISTWHTSNVTNMQSVFNNVPVFNQDISNWNTSNVTNVSFMFQNDTAFDQNIRGWNTTNVSTYSNMFNGASNMLSTYNGVTGFGTTPTSAFFNFTPTLDFTFDNGATAIGAVSLPYQGSGTFSVDWGDGVTDTSLTHTYSATTRYRQGSAHRNSHRVLRFITGLVLINLRNLRITHKMITGVGVRELLV